ncbi:hypothetical protein EP331_10095 [bacterium]|nr:MAG: hypothetical protein EP331_10095 [bacterium]
MKRLAISLLFLTAISLASSIQQAYAQGKLRFDIDKEQKTFASFYIRTTSWLRYSELNPGSTIYNEPTDSYTDFSIRRFRFGVNAQLTPKLYTSLMLGGNNINIHTSKTFNIHVLDAYTEYAFSNAFELGIGKSSWVGLSRWDIRSSKSLMGLDAPLFSLNTVDKTDDIGRVFGIFAKGKAMKFDYRVSVSQQLTPPQTTTKADADFAYHAPRMKTSGYVKYQFLDEESNKSAYTTGTYLGKKSVLALGAGIMYQPRALWTDANAGIANAAIDTVYHALFHWAADIFYDAPIGTNGSAITSYLGFYQFDFGPNYVRNVAANNIANGTIASQAIYNGNGTAFPMVGTGSNWFFQLGYLLPKDLLGKDNGQLQPNIAVQYANWEKLDDPMLVYELNVNWFFKGHDNKLTFGYQSRPLFHVQANSEIKSYKRLGMFIMQYQIEIN